MEQRIKDIIDESLELHQKVIEMAPIIKYAAEIMIDSVRSGNKIMFAGNGGSAADAQHLAAELVNRFQRERHPLAGLALTTDTSIMTAISNDYSYDEVFAKQVMALGRRGDVLVGISTSGNSGNIIKAIKAAKEQDIRTVSLTGEGGLMKEISDCCLAVPSSCTPRIQECHILIGHILCEFIENSVCND